MKLPRKFRVFIASPTDAAPERDSARSLIADLNCQLKETKVEFEFVGWESNPGTARRPQEAINELIDECDFLVCIFNSTWGSNPGGGIYSSGTEEELFTGLVGLNDPNHRLRDVWLMFLDYPGVQRSKEIEALKHQIIERNALLFESAESLTEFSEKLQNRLTGWASATDGKVARRVPLVPSSGRDVIGASHLSQRGSILAGFGELEAAEKSFFRATEVGGAKEKLAYAQFLGRQSRSVEALKVVGEALDELTSASDLRPAIVAEALVSRATLERRSGNQSHSEASLRSALPHVGDSDPSVALVRARINDELGVLLYQKSLAFRRTGKHALFVKTLAEAQETLVTALSERIMLADSVGVAQTKVNLGRLAVAEGRHDDAIEYHRTAIKTLESVGGEVLANGYLAKAQALLSKCAVECTDHKVTNAVQCSISERAIDSAHKSLATNQQLKNGRGEAMALHVTAQIHHRRGEKKEAESFARQCIEANAALGLTAPASALRLITSTE